MGALYSPLWLVREGLGEGGRYGPGVGAQVGDDVDCDVGVCGGHGAGARNLPGEGVKVKDNMDVTCVGDGEGPGVGVVDVTGLGSDVEGNVG